MTEPPICIHPDQSSNRIGWQNEAWKALEAMVLTRSESEGEKKELPEKKHQTEEEDWKEACKDVNETITKFKRKAGRNYWRMPS